MQQKTTCKLLWYWLRWWLLTLLLYCRVRGGFHHVLHQDSQSWSKFWWQQVSIPNHIGLAQDQIGYRQNVSGWVSPTIICLFLYLLGSYKAAKAGFACSAILCQHGLHVLQHSTSDICRWLHHVHSSCNAVPCGMNSSVIVLLWSGWLLCNVGPAQRAQFYWICLLACEVLCLTVRTCSSDASLVTRAAYHNLAGVHTVHVSNTTSLRSWHFTQLCTLGYLLGNVSLRTNLSKTCGHLGLDSYMSRLIWSHPLITKLL